MKRTTAGLLFLTAAISTSAQTPATSENAPRGDGAMTCRQFNTGTARPVVNTQQVGWTLGYLSAVEASGTPLRRVSDSYVRGWIGSFCARNDAVPTATIEVATRALLDSLRTNSR